MFDRNTLIALVLVGLILLGLPYYYKLISPPAPPEETVVEQVTKPRPSEDIGDEEMISTQTAQKEFPADTSLAAASAADAPHSNQRNLLR